MEPSDHGSYMACALREVAEEVVLPKEWAVMLGKTVSRHPQGHRYLEFDKRNDRHKVVMWVIRIPNERAIYPVLTELGKEEVQSDSLTWRPILSVIDNLKQFGTLKCYGKALEDWLMNPSQIHKLLSLVCMHDILQEVGYAMLFAFKSQEAQIIWAGLGMYDPSLRPVMAGRRWVLRLSLLKRWAAVSNVFGKSLELQQIRQEAETLYRVHQSGKLEEEWTRLSDISGNYHLSWVDLVCHYALPIIRCPKKPPKTTWNGRGIG